MTRRSGAASYGLMRVSVWPAILAAGMLAVLTFLPGLLLALGWLRPLAELLVVKANGDIYVALLTTVAATGGAFLALYFASLSVVASAAYAALPRAIHVLAVEEKIGSAYLAFVAHITAFSLLALAVNGLGATPSRLILTYCALMATVAVFAFVPLGRHIFAFFDPRMLSRGPARDFLRSLRAATVSGPRHSRAAFQRFFRQRALQALTTVEDLTDYASSASSVRGEVVRGLSGTMLDLLVANAAETLRIPTSSEWFERTHEFRPLTLSDYPEADIALRTGTTPAARQVPDHSHVVRRVAPVVERSLRALIAAGDNEETTNLINRAHVTIERLGACLAIEDALFLLESLHPALSDVLNSPAPVTERRQDTTVGWLNAWASAFPSAALAWCNAVMRLTAPDSLDAAAACLARRSPKRFYRGTHPRAVLSGLESFRQRLLFEMDVEGSLLCADWYLREVLARTYVQYIADSCASLSATVTDLFHPARGSMRSIEEPLSRAEMIRVGIGVAVRLEGQLEGLGQRCNELHRFAVTKEDWPTVDLRGSASRLAELRRELLRALASLVPQLRAEGRPSQLPDYVGFARGVIGQELVGMMADKSVDGFNALFVAYFDATLRVFDAHRRASQDPRQPHQMRVALQTVLDLVDVSGLALLFSELHGTGFYRAVVGLWDEYFAACEDSVGAMRLFIFALEDEFTLPILSVSSTTRMEWQRVFIDAMAEEGFAVDGYGPWEEEERARADHDSVIVQSIRPYVGLMHFSPGDYFAAVYLAEHAAAKGEELPHRVQECKRDIEREARLRTEKGSAHDPGVQS